MITKAINLMKITLLLFVIMSVADGFKLINLSWWHYITILYVTPNASLVIWMIIEWIRFNYELKNERI